MSSTQPNLLINQDQDTGMTALTRTRTWEALLADSIGEDAALRILVRSIGDAVQNTKFSIR